MPESSSLPDEPQDVMPLPSGEAKVSADDKIELQSYIEIGSTTARTIRWLTFAIAICVGASLLVLASHHFGIQQFAYARAMAIKKECFGDNVVPPYTEKCRNYIKDAGGGFYMGAFRRNQEDVDAQRDVIKVTRLVEIPLVNIKLVTPDFVIILIALSIFFLFWLRLTLEFIRNTLCNLFNDSTLPSQQATRTLPAHFLLLWPGGARRKAHRVIWYILLSLLGVILLVTISDVVEVFIARGLPGDWKTELRELPGWDQFRLYAYGKIALELALGGVVTMLLLQVRTLIRDVRNLLMLIEWGARAFEPLVHRLFKRIGDPLVRWSNEILYMESDEGYLLSLRLTFQEVVLSGNQGGWEVIFSAPVDLWRHMAEENRKAKSLRAPKWMFGSNERKERTTLEDEKMRMFFFNVLTGSGSDKTFAKVFLDNVIWPRKLKALIRRCRETFGAEDMKNMGYSNDKIDMLLAQGRGTDDIY